MRNPYPDKNHSYRKSETKRQKIIPSESLPHHSQITWNWASPLLCSFSVP